MRTFLARLGVLVLVVLPELFAGSHRAPVPVVTHRCPMCRGALVAGCGGRCPHCAFPLAPLPAKAIR